MNRIIAALCAAGMTCAPLFVMAEAPAISEAVVLQAAIQASPDHQSAYKIAAEEKADAEQMGRLGNPTIEFNSVRTSAPAGDSTAYDIEVEQPLKLSQLTGTRARFSRALYEQAELREQHAILQSYWNVKILYAQAWQQQRLADLYGSFKTKAASIAGKVGTSVKHGQSPVSEGSLFAGDVAKLGSDLEQIKAQSATLRLQLEKASSMALADTRLADPQQPAFTLDAAALEEESRKNASLVRLLESDLKTAERQRQAAIADSSMPEISPRFIYGRNTDDNEDSVGLGVVLSIPLWDRNQAERQKAQAARVYAQRQLDTLQNVPLSHRLNSLVASIRMLDTRIAALEQDALPNYRKGFEQAQKSFNAGQTDAAALWQIRERLFETEQDAINAQLQALEARRILSLETGILPQEVIVP